MVEKCANSSCKASFLRLAEGRLFRLETDPALSSTNARETEYFWLCEPCSAGMTLCLVRDGTVAAIGLADSLRNGPHVALNLVDRENGAFLRSVSFLTRSHPQGT